jgi:hypothetical protein
MKDNGLIVISIVAAVAVVVVLIYAIVNRRWTRAALAGNSKSGVGAAKEETSGGSVGK